MTIFSNLGKSHQNKLWTTVAFVLFGTSVIVNAALFLQIFKGKHLLIDATPDEPASTAVYRINALGRIEPEGGLIQVSAPTASGLSTPTVSQRLKQWFVSSGDTVQAEQKIAVMHGLEKAQAAVTHAQTQVEIFQAQLAQVEAGASAGQVEAQERQIAALRAQLSGDLQVQELSIASARKRLSQAETSYQRFLELYEDGGISEATLDEKQLQKELAQTQLQQAQAILEHIRETGRENIASATATLTSLTDVPLTDVTAAEARLRNAITSLEQAQVDLEALYVRSPIDGQVLSLNTMPGENVGADGLATLGSTRQMYAVAEVYESDARYLQVGQRATIKSEANGFDGELQGRVEYVGINIEKPNTVADSPLAPADASVVKVKIRLNPDDSDRVKMLNRMQVWVTIEADQ